MIGWYSRAPIDGRLSNAAAMSWTCRDVTARPRVGRRAGRRLPAAGEPQLMLVAADAEPSVGGASAGRWLLEVRLDAGLLRVPTAASRSAAQ